MKPLIALIAVTTTLAACSEPIAPTRAPQTHAPAANLLDLLHRARLTLTTPSSAVTQASTGTWALTKVGALDPATSNVTWTITATQGATGAKKLVVTGKVTLKNTGTKAAPIGNVVVTLQHKPSLQWIALASDVATTTAGDAATSAKIVKWTNNSDDSDGVDDDDSERGDSWNVTTMDENSASGPLVFTPAASGAASLAPGAVVTLSFTASYDNTVLNLPVGRKVRAQIYVTFGNAGLGLTTAANLDIDGSGTIDADEARVRTVTARLGEKVVPAPTVVSTPVTLSDAVANITTTGTVTYTNPVFTLGATSGTVKVHVAGGASGGTIANCAHLTGTGTNLQACNTQLVPAVSSTPGAWKNGDVITYSQGSWGDPTHAAGHLLLASYGTVYASTFGELEVGILGTSGTSILFTSSLAVVDFLPQVGPSASLVADVLNPTSTPAGLFGSEVVTLRLNVDFADAGLLSGTAGVRFGDLKMCGFATLPGLNGMSVRGFLNLTSTLLGGGTGVHSIAQVDTPIDELNEAFEGGVVSQFARDHLRIGSCT